MCLTDPKVLHNSAIAEYVDGGQRDPRKLLGALENLKQRLEDARAEAEFGEADALGDMDPSLTAYNMAVLLYQLKQYARCRTLLEDMFANIEPIDEFLAFKLCFLLLDVYLIQRHADRATEVLAYLEKSFATLTAAHPRRMATASPTPPPRLRSRAARAARKYSSQQTGQTRSRRVARRRRSRPTRCARRSTCTRRSSR